jgi:hypothetical protein
VVKAIAPGTATITVQTVDGKKNATCQVTVQAPATAFATPAAVDLGLSVKWGSFNLGATAPEEIGNYYAWGETEPKSSNLGSYKWYFQESWSYGGYTKYCSNPDAGYNGFADGKTELDPEDDVVRVKLGGQWRMPTKEEIQELVYQCTWTWTTKNGMKGNQVTGPNGKSIFLPAAGYLNGEALYEFSITGYNFSSQLPDDIADLAYGTESGVWGDESFQYLTVLSRLFGVTIRPVRD